MNIVLADENDQDSSQYMSKSLLEKDNVFAKSLLFNSGPMEEPLQLSTEKDNFMLVGLILFPLIVAFSM
ncbi:MAG: hypothetical protein HRT90_10225 [Candidatus Margulisbacteria bacterium]|nr:hypothetical protein [Candidatus Margulisiibacteriota bacterium]